MRRGGAERANSGTDIRAGKFDVSIFRGHLWVRESGWVAGEVSGKKFDLAWEEGSDVAGVVGGLPSEGGAPKENNSGKNIRGL